MEIKTKTCEDCGEEHSCYSTPEERAARDARQAERDQATEARMEARLARMRAERQATAGG